MKIKKLKFLILFCLGATLPLMQVLPAPAQAASFTCMNNYYDFILNVNSENLRSENLKDIFTLGYCPLNDILLLDDELDTLKTNFRNAANACESTLIYEEDYERILMEMYFVRHLQAGEALNAVDAAQLEQLTTEKLNTLKKEMKTAFVDIEQRVDESTFNRYFEQWTFKYEDRVANYRNCEEGPWAELTVTWEDFTETIQELDFSVERNEHESLKEILIPKVDVEADEDMTALGNSIKNVWNYLKTKKEKNRANIDPALSVSELTVAGGSVSFDEALEQLNSSVSEYDLELRSADRMSEYEILYGAGGSVQSTNLQSIMLALNEVLTEVNNKDLPSIAGNTALISDKQCN
ncbi:hypothetical protein IPG41_06250 [Candidatus Peregrinibacteria bacterium]|nr:MAG: hypothetical protein IPG41_06250 [Candidatus Peregrinibacteria bacterium]